MFPFLEVGFGIGRLGFLDERAEAGDEVVHGLGPPHEHGDDEEAGDEAQLLVADQEALVLGAAPRGRGGGGGGRGGEVAAAVDGLVEDVCADERARLGGAEVARVVELADPRGDLADLPAAEARGDEVPAAVLLQAPEARVGLEGLAAVVVPAAVERQVPRARELAVRRLHQRLELPVRAGGLAVGHRRRAGRGGGGEGAPPPCLSACLSLPPRCPLDSGGERAEDAVRWRRWGEREKRE